jgi:acyl-CoA carboxylase epsilon subunit
VSAPEEQAPAPPVLLRIVRGAPDDAQIAALVAVLSAASAQVAPAQAPAATASQWAPPERLLRAPVHPSGWWASSLPR